MIENTLNIERNKKTTGVLESNVYFLFDFNLFE